MDITDPGALLPLTTPYTTTTSTVLVCEVHRDVADEVTHWEIFLKKDEDEDFDMNNPIIGTNEATNVKQPHMYHRLFDLDRDTCYNVQVRPVFAAYTGPLTEVVTFETFPTF